MARKCSLLSSSLFILVLTLVVPTILGAACTRQRCCFSNPCTSTYCLQKNSQTWISTENYNIYQYTKLVISNNECKPCPYDCRTCSSQAVCTTCAKGFYSDTTTGKCTLCSDRCLSCTVVNSITKCVSCEDGAYLDATTQSCKSCPQGAKTCSSPTAIIDCLSGYKKSSNSLYCTACPTNCLSCPVSDTVCASCTTGYYLSSGACVKCSISNCQTCMKSGSSVVCTLCNSGYILASGSCTQCPSNCKMCSSASVCTACNSGFYVIGGACSPVSTAVSDCLAYSSSSVCSSCNSNYFLTNGLCYPCSLLCSTCEGSHFGSCSSCNSNAVLFNKMCLITNFPSTSTYNLYFSFPASSSLLSLGSISCGNKYATGSTITIDLNNLRAYKISVNWKLYSKGGSTTYSVELRNSANTTTKTYSTGSQQKYNNWCDNDLSTYYYMDVERSQNFTEIKKLNQLTFSTDNGMVLALQQIIVTAFRCNQLCVECSQTLCTECLMTKLYTQDAYCVYTCSNNYYIYQANSMTNPNQCLSDCPLGTYTLSSNVSCVACTSPCLTCLNQKFCLSCVDGYYLTKENTCKQTCPYRFYGKIQTKTCEKCVGRCLQCLNEEQCLSCKVGFLLNTTKTCVDSCQSNLIQVNGLYASLTTLYCESCNANCLNCQYNSTQCSQCVPTKYLYDSQCLSSCPIGYFAPSGSNICSSCDFPCKQCQSTSSTCTSCLDGYLYSSACLSDCPSGYFKNTQTLQCTACDSKCTQCYGSSTYCLSCKNTYFYYQYQCLSQCPFGFYAPTGSQICTECVNLCSSCTNETYCLSCKSNFMYQGQCLSSGECPAGYFADMVTLKCQPCASPCQQCQYFSTYCTKCSISEPNGMIFLQNHKCLSSCSSAFYYPKKNSTSAVCEACEEPCLTCTSSSVCLSCISGYKYSNGMCSSTCSAGTYFDSDINDCVNCSVKCDMCTSASFCQKCSSSYYVNFISATSNECTKTCSVGFYGQSLSQSCQKCIYPCSTCTSSIDCLTCESGIMYLNRCISSCPDSTFMDVTNNICINCSGNCLTCSVTSSYCQSCKDNFFLYHVDHTCLSQCPSNYFAQNTTKSCMSCPSTCLTCLNSTFCLSCISGKTYMNSNNYCVESCPVGSFGNNITAKCQACDVKCATCKDSASNCISCPTGYYFIKLSYSAGDCLTSCPSTYYPESSNCYECSFPCKTCSSSSGCITCIEGTFYHSVSSSCLLNCPTGTFYNFNNYSCSQCQYPCKSCDGNEKYCLSCSADQTTNQSLYLYNGTCVSVCPSQYYADDTGICNKCFGLCKTCSSKYYCTSCVAGYLYEGFCYSSCPLGTFANTTINTCSPCQSPCSECILKSTYCTKCTGGLFVYKGSCSSVCPNGTYEDQGLCQSCTFPCISCLNQNSCIECLGGYLLYMNISCIPDATNCPNDFYKMDSKYCVPVTWCPSNYFIDETAKTCSFECDRKKYTNLNTKRCENSCSEGWYAGTNLVCSQWVANPPSTLMGMSAISFIQSSYLYIEILFNETVKWVDVEVNMYTLKLVSSRLLFEDLSNRSSNRLLINQEIVPEYTMKIDSPTMLKLKPASYPERIQLNLPAYRLKSSETSFPLQNPDITIKLPLFTEYSSAEIYSGMIMGQFSQGISWFIILLSFFFLFKNRLSDLYVLWDTVQLLYLLIFLDMQYPPNINEFFRGLKFTHFTFLPSIFSSSLTRNTSSSPFYAYSYDNSFIRNTGGLFLALIVVFGILLLLKISETLIKKVPCIKSRFKQYPEIKGFIYKGVLRYRWHHISDIMFLTYVYMMLFAFSELYYMSQNPNHTFSNALAILTCLCYILWVLFVGFKLKKHFKNISKGKMVNNLKCFYRGIQKDNKFGVSLVLIRYARKLFYTLIISVFSADPMFALPILMFSSVLMALFLFINLPYKKKLSNLIALGSQMVMVIMYILLAMINFNNETFDASMKHTLGWVCSFLLALMIFALIFQIFCKTMFYLEPQDNPEKEAKDETKEKMLTDKEKQFLRKKAEEFFDSLLPRLRERLNLDQDSDDQMYKNYESGDSENSENNQERQKGWGNEQSQNSDEFKHYDNTEHSQEDPTSINSKMKIQAAPQYLVRCVKEIQ